MAGHTVDEDSIGGDVGAAGAGAAAAVGVGADDGVGPALGCRCNRCDVYEDDEHEDGD